MKRCLIICLLLVVSIGFISAQSADTLSLVMPQYMNPFYDSFSRNYPGVTAAGKGYTGAAYLGDVSGINLNPASLLPDSLQLSVEIDLKPPVNAVGYPNAAEHSSRVPFGMITVNGRLSDKLSAALVYSLPKAIYLDDFSMWVNMGADLVQRYPSYYLAQFTANASYHTENWHLGLNLHNQVHMLDDPVFMHSWNRIRSNRYALRVQPGIIYDAPKFRFGISVMPETSFNWDLTYANYKVILPAWASAGINIKNGENTYMLDAEFEQFSKICSHFDDKLTFKAGFEKDLGKNVYRLGYIYSPEVFHGTFRLPYNTEATPQSSFWWGPVKDYLKIEPNTQHFLTGGYSYFYRYGSINLALMQEVGGEANHTQFSFSTSFYLNSIKNRKFLKFDE